MIFALTIALFVSLAVGMNAQESTESGPVSTQEDNDPDADPRLKDAIDTLQYHQIPITTEGMRKRLQLMDPDHPSHQQLEAQATVLVKDLNSNDYLVREKATRSLKLMTTVPKLQLAAAMKAADPEVAYRARVILDYVESRNRRDTEQGIIESVCTIVQARQIKGLANVLLETLKLVEDPNTQAAVGKALAASVIETDAQLLKSGIRSEVASQRIASSAGLLKLLGSDATDVLLRCLESEKDDRVRLAIARSLANIGVRDSLPILVGLLDSKEMGVRVECGQVLQALTDLRFDFVAYDGAEKRKKSVEQWQAWLADNAETAELQFPIIEKHLVVGRILYADYKLGKAVEVDMNGKELWSVKQNSAWNVQGLPNGHRLVTSYSGRVVIEYDRDGQEVWKLDRTPGELMGLHRLDNGNTLVGCGTKVVEYQRDGTSIWEANAKGRVSNCQRLNNGNTLLSLFDKNMVVEIDRQGQTVWSIDTPQNPMSAQRTREGTTLIATLGDPRVREFDQRKRLVWEHSVQGGNSAAIRLPNGDTLINSRTEIQLVSPDKKVRWSVKGLKHSFGLSAF